MSAKKIVFGNIKGGTGKTTVTNEVGYCLSHNMHKKVLMIDFDSQCNLTIGTGISDTDIKGKTIYDCLMANCSFADSIREIRKNLYLIGGSRRLLSQYFVGSEDIYLLKESMEYIESLPEIKFDYILIDIGPESGNLMKMSMLASDYMVLVSSPTDFGYEGGIQVCSDLRAGKEHYKGFEIEPLGIALNSVRKTKVANFNIEKFEALGQKFAPVFKTKIRQSSIVDEAKELKKTATEYQPDSAVAEDFKALTKEIVKRVER